MGLLEIVKNENNDLEKINYLKKFVKKNWEQVAIICNDTPDFLGNRVGVYSMQCAIDRSFQNELSIEEADTVFGRPMGISKNRCIRFYMI
jgi:3-hydroxyacyl-CoA dehydrogenase